MRQLQGLDVLVLDALRREGHSTHFSLDEAVEVAKQLGTKQTFFTHMSHDLEHDATTSRLPENMALAYDGLSIPLT
jgi:phosphoribosyl 1,2-cyclic phosphate phosphodiesterase